MTLKIKKLDNGLTLICDTNKKTNICTIAVGVKTGSTSEMDLKDYGISHVLEHMMFKGTKKRDYKQISKDIENIGGTSNACTSNDKTMYYITATKEDFDTISEILFDMFQNSTFPIEELTKEKDVIYQEIKMYEDDPSSVVNDLIQELTYKGSSFEHKVIGFWDTVLKITREDLIAYREKHYTTDNTYVSASGNITMEQLEQVVSKYYKPTENKHNFVVPKAKFQKGNFKEVEKDMQQSQSIISLGESVANTKYSYSVSVALGILGQGMSSKLFQRIREELGLVYGIGVTILTNEDRIAYLIHYASDYDKVELINNNIYELMNDMCEGKFTDEELEKFKKMVLVNLSQQDLNYNSACIRNMSTYMDAGKCPSIKYVVKKINAITREDVINASKKLFNKNNFNYAYVKPKTEDK